MRHVLIPQYTLSNYVTHDKINNIDVHLERVVMTTVRIIFQNGKPVLYLIY